MDPALPHSNAGLASGDEARPGIARVRIDYREVVATFVALVILTAVELGVARMPGIGYVPRTMALVAIALAKASLIALFFMHLKYETTVLKLTVALPLATPPLYGLILMGDAVWRHLG
jgi:cytochrome c oxidase subunit IV